MTDPEKNIIAVVGATNTGKTTYFAVLDRALRDANFTLRSGSEAFGTRSDEFIYKLRRYIAAGYFPPQTDIGEVPVDFALEITSPDGDFYSLSFIDPPGEIFENKTVSKKEGESDEDFQARKGDLDQQRAKMEEQCSEARSLLVLINIEGSREEIIESWRFTLERFIDRAINGDPPLKRIAVVFTKADLLPWQARNRTRSAEDWLKNHPQLSDIYNDACAIRPADGRTPDIGYFFCSAIGWSKGQPNCRTMVQPRDLSHEILEKATDWEDLIPDPAIIETAGHPVGVLTLPGGRALAGSGGERKRIRRGGRMEGSYPAFTDPLRFVTETVDSDQLGGDPVGVLTLPGRRALAGSEGKFISPWNIIEPLLWAGGYEKLAAKYYSVTSGNDEPEGK